MDVLPLRTWAGTNHPLQLTGMLRKVSFKNSYLLKLVEGKYV
jgi:hypothetical protein